MINLEAEDAKKSEVSGLLNNLQVVGVNDGASDGEETAVRFQPGENTSLSLSWYRSWKKEARHRGQHQSFQPLSRRTVSDGDMQEGIMTSMGQ